MPASVVYKAAAIAEIDDAFGAYEAERRGLGVEFLDELARIEGHLRANPALYQRVGGNGPGGEVRRAVLRRFPYGLFYVVDDGRISGGADEWGPDGRAGERPRLLPPAPRPPRARRSPGAIVWPTGRRSGRFVLRCSGIRGRRLTPSAA